MDFVGASFRHWGTSLPWFSTQDCTLADLQKKEEDKYKTAGLTKHYFDGIIEGPDGEPERVSRNPASRRVSWSEEIRSPSPPPEKPEESLPQPDVETRHFRPAKTVDVEHRAPQTRRRRLHWIGQQEEPLVYREPTPREEEDEEVVEEEEPDLDPGEAETAAPVKLPSPLSSPSPMPLHPTLQEDSELRVATHAAEPPEILLQSLYERQSKKKVPSRRKEDHHQDIDNASVSSDGSYQEEVKSARLQLRSSLGTTRKEIKEQSAYPSGLVERIEGTFKELGHLFRSADAHRSGEKVQKKSPSASPAASPGASPIPKSLNPNEKEIEGLLSGGNLDAPPAIKRSLSALSTHSMGGDPQLDQDQDDDYDSDDEEAMTQRYNRLCDKYKIERLTHGLTEQGQRLPRETIEESRAQEERLAHGQARIPTRVEKVMKQEIDAYHGIIKERLRRLGGTGDLSETTDHTEAVKKAVLKYHMTCEKAGKIYAFEKPQPGDIGFDIVERRKLTRFVRDLEDEDPDRFDHGGS